MSKKDNTKSTKNKTTKSTNSKNKPKVANKKEDIKKLKEVKEIKVKEEIKEETNKIKKIEEKNKKETKKIKSSKPFKEKFMDLFIRVDEKRKIIYGFLGGLLLGLLIMVIFMPDRIATLKDGTQPVANIDGTNITADELYEDMKDYYSVSLLLDRIDTLLLTEMYEEDDEMTESVNSNAEYYLNVYEQYYGYDEEEFLARNGFANYDEFLEYLRLDYRRTKYQDDYIKKSLEESEIEDYYNENVVGDINCQHVLVTVSDSGLTEDEAKKLAGEIIDKLNDGTSWEDIQTEYKDQITYEDLGYQAWNASLETSFLDALKEMDNDSFSKEPVKTSYGYHVIHRLDQKETPSLEDAKEEIIENLIADAKSEDENLIYKALISLREEKGLEFSDTVMKEKYEDYCKEYK